MGEDGSLVGGGWRGESVVGGADFEEGGSDPGLSRSNIEYVDSPRINFTRYIIKARHQKWF